MLIVGGAHSPIGAILGVVFITVVQEGLQELGTQILHNAHEAGGVIFAATNVALGVSILLVLMFEPRGLAHRWSVLKDTIQLWPFPHR
jgi:branched-chain amino acid transport system permease protein